MASSSFASALSVPAPWMSRSQDRKRFFESVGRSAMPVLICDYDGTLAPFREDKMQAVPYTGVSERMESIARRRTKLAFVSGRPVSELIALLPTAATVDVWGMHGREHRAADGSYVQMEPTVEQRSALDQAQAALASAGWAALTERKSGSVALHWRTLQDTGAPASLREAQRAAEAAFVPHLGVNSMALLPFDGGLEMRAEDRTKAHAVRALLEGAAPNAAVFLGDDTTDEDAFEAVQEYGGLGFLVRSEFRPSHATFALKPPDDLLTFLDDWLAAIAGEETNKAGPVT